MAEDKGFLPTKRRLERARKDGQVCKSRIFSQACAVIAALGSFYLMVPGVWVRAPILLNYCFSEASSAALWCAKDALSSALQLVVLTLAAGACAGVMAEVLQVGFRFDGGLLGVRSERVHPIAGLRQIATNVTQLWRTVVMVAVLAMVVATVLITGLERALTTNGGIIFVDAVLVQAWGKSLLLLICVTASLLFIACGAFEYMLNRREYLRKLSMSVDEVRREYREEEGDPLLKSARRSMHEMLALKDLERRVRNARVIVVERNELVKADSS